MADLNPFVVDTPVEPDELIDRESELAILLESAEAGHNRRLSAPRRYGKTSLLWKLAAEAERIGMPVAQVDFYGVVSIDEVLTRVEAGYEQGLKGPLGRWFTGVRRSIRPTLRAGPGEASVEIEFLGDTDAERALTNALDLPRRIFEREGRRTLVIFDEFQEILSAGNLDALLRTSIQRQRKFASYVFAGSHPGLMAELFGSKGRPLYGQSRPVELGPLPDEALADYISERFADGARDVGSALGPLLELVRGHPQRAMLAAHHLWELTPRRKKADEETFSDALDAMFRENQELFERTWDDFTVNERRLIAAVAWIGPWGGGTSLYSRSTLERFRLAKGTARDVRASLIRQGELERVGRGGLRIIDPLFEAWIASERRSRS